MSKKCSIYPLIPNSTGYSDSILFKEILSKNDREKAKTIYETMLSKDFENIFGNWQLYQRYKLNTLTNEDTQLLNSLYNGNIENLEKELPLDLLNELYEPKYNIESTPANSRGTSSFVIVSSKQELNKFIDKLGLTESSFNNLLKSLNKKVYYKNTESTEGVLNSEIILSTSQDYHNKMIVDIVDMIISATNDPTNENLKNDSFNNFVRSNVFRKANSFGRTSLMVDFITKNLNKFRFEVISKLKAINPQLAEEIDDNYKKLISDLEYVNPESGKYSMKLKSILAHLNKHYGTNFEDNLDIPTIEDESDIDDSTELLKVMWDDGKKMLVDYRKNVAQEIKSLLSMSVSSSFIGNISKQISEQSPYGITQPLSIDELWNTFISISILNKDKESILKELGRQNKTIYNGVLTKFIEVLSNNEILWNRFNSSVNLPVFPNKTINIRVNGKTINVSESDNNFRAFAHNVANIAISNVIANNFETLDTYVPNFAYNTNIKLSEKDLAKHGYDKSLSTFAIDGGINLSKSKKEAISDLRLLSPEQKYDLLLKRLKLLGLSHLITASEINELISENLNYVPTVEFYGNPFSKTLTGKDFFDTLKSENEFDVTGLRNKNVDLSKNRFINTINDLNEAVIYTMYSLYELKRATFENKSLITRINKFGLNFNKEFDGSNNIKKLANIITYKYYKNISLSFYNENGDMEYSPQQSSYLTDIRKALIPINGKLDFNYAKKALKDKLSSTELVNNTFLYNYDGNGLFDFQKDANDNMVLYNGLPTITNINPNYLANVDMFQYSGIKNTNMNVGTKYDGINGDNWLLQSIQAIGRGQYLNPSAEASRLYGFQSMVYGVGNLNFNGDGTYARTIDTLREMGLYTNKGFVTRSLNDEYDAEGNVIKEGILNPDGTIKDNVLFYVPKVKNGVTEYILISGRELKSKSENDVNSIIDLHQIISALELRLRYAYEDEISKGLPKDEVIKFNKEISYLRDVYSRNLKTNTEAELHSIIKELISRYFNISDNNLNSIDYLNQITKDGVLEQKEGTPRDIEFIIAGILANDGEINNHIKMYDKDSQKAAIIRNRVNNPQQLLADDLQVQVLYNEVANSIQYKSIARTINSEVSVMQQALENMFDISKEVDRNGNIYISKLEVKPEVQHNANIGKLSAPIYHNNTAKDKTIKFDKNGIEIISPRQVLDNNGMPTGRIFQFLRLSYLEDGKKINLESFARSKGYIGQGKYDMFQLVLDMKSNPDSKDLFNRLVVDFIDSWIANIQQTLIENLASMEDDLKYMVVNKKPATIPGTQYKFDTGTNRNTYLVEIAEPKSENKKVELDEDGNVIENDSRPGYSSDQTNKYYRQFLTSVIITDYLNHVNIGEDLLFGRQYEYKHDIEINKRIPQVIRNGRSNGDNTTYNSMVINDVETVTNMLPELHKALDEKLGKEAVSKMYDGELEIGNGLSFITVDELIVRLKNADNYENFKPYIDSLLYTDKPNYSNYLYIVEQLKYFVYNRQLTHDSIVPGDMRSYQEKNSTIVLFPKLFEGTSYAKINEFMLRHKVDSINFVSGAKNGGQPVFRMHDTVIAKNEKGENQRVGYNLRTTQDIDGNIVIDDRIDRNLPRTEDNIMDMSEWIVKIPRSSIRVQQDTVGHILDEKGRLATQWIKKLFTNMSPNDVYEVNGKTYSGKSNNPNKPGLFELFHHALSTNVKHDRDKLIGMLGGIKDGKIKYDINGNIDIDHNKLLAYIRDYYFKTGDIPFMRAFDNSEFAEELSMSLNTPIISKQITQILLSAVSKNVKQSLGHVHAVGMPDVFLQPENFKYGKSDIIRDNNKEAIEKFKENGMLSLSSKFYEQVEREGNFELKAEDPNIPGSKAQVIINMWDSRFKKFIKTKIVTRPDGSTHKVEYIDIDSIPSEALTIFGTRIPNEGFQSTFVAEVVGFLNTSSSQIIVPKQLAARTGWDYDIDTVYIYTRHLYETAEGVLKPISYENSSDYNTRERMLMSYIQNYYQDDYMSIVNKKNIALSLAYRNFKRTISDGATDSFRTVKNISKFYNEAKRTNDNAKLQALTNKVSKIITDILDNTSIEELQNNPDSLEMYNLLKELIVSVGTSRTINGNILKNIIASIDNNVAVSVRDYINEINELFTESLSNSHNLVRSIDLNGADNKVNKKFEIFTNPIFRIAAKHDAITMKAIKEDAKAEFDKNKENILINFENDLAELIDRTDIQESFDSLDEMSKLPRKTRENIIVDIILARMAHPDTTEYKEKANTFNNIRTIAEGINNEIGISTETTNYANILDRTRYTNMTKGIAQMKGIAVSNGNIYSILGSTNATLGSQVAIPFVMTLEEFKGSENMNIYDIYQILDSYVGSGNYEYLPATNTKEARIVIYNTYIANSRLKNWRNINGELITNQASEVLANVLDAVKEQLGFNISTNTLSMVDLLANTPINHYTDIYNNGVRKPNSFAYSHLLLHQGIIQKFSNRLNLLSKTGEFETSDVSMTKVRSEVMENIIRVFNSFKFNTPSNSQITILDVFKAYVKGKAESTNVINKINRIDSWKLSIRENKSLNTYSDSILTFDDIYSEMIELLTDNVSLESILNSYGIVESEINDFIKLTEYLSDNNIYSGSIVLTSKGKYKSLTKDHKGVNSYKTLNELQHIYRDGIAKGFHNIDDYMRNLNSYDGKSKIEFINYLVEQLAIQNMYSQIQSSVDIINKAASVLKTDKLGASPDTSVSNKLFEDLSKLYLDFNKLTKDLKGITSSAISELSVQFYKLSKEDTSSINTIMDRYKLMQSIIDSYNAMSKEITTTDSKGTTIQVKRKTLKMENYITPLFIDNQNIALSIFPEAINGKTNEDFDYKNSVYPYLQAQYVYTNHFSKQILANSILKEHPIFKDLLQGIYNKFNIQHLNPKSRLTIENDIVNILVNEYLYKAVPFLRNSELNDESLMKEKSRILGIDYNKSGNINSPQFKELSVASKVLTIQTNFNKLGLTSKQIDYISSLEINADSKTLIDYGYERINLKDRGLSSNYSQQVFLSLYYHDNANVRDTMRDLIRYSFLTTGLKFGNNIAKHIPPSLYYEVPSNEILNSFPELQNNENQFWQYNQALHRMMKDVNLLDISSEAINNKSELILSNIYDNRSLSPLVSNSRGKDAPKFNTVPMEGFKEFGVDPKANTKVIIKELKSKVDNSFYATKYSIQVRDKGIKTYKRYDIDGSDYVYYYPVNRKLYGEFGIESQDSVVNKNKEILSNEQFEEIIRNHDATLRAAKDEDQVLNSEIIGRVDRVIYTNNVLEVNKEDSINPNLVTKYDGTYSALAKELVAKNDIVIYIGDDSIRRSAFESTKTYYISLEELNHNSFKFLEGLSNLSVAIVGDTLSNIKYDRSAVNKTVKGYIEFAIAEYDISSVKSIHKLGIGEAVFQALSSTNIDAEYIEVGEVDNVLNVEVLTTAQKSATFNATYTSLMDVMNRQRDIHFKLSKLYKDLRNDPTNKVDIFRGDYSNLETIYNELPEMVKYDFMNNIIDTTKFEETFNTNMKIVDAILTFILDEKVSFTDLNGNVKSIAFRDWNAAHIAQGSNVEAKIKLLKKLQTYTYLMNIARTAMDIPIITKPRIPSKDDTSYSKEARDIIDKVRKRMQSLNDAIQNMNYSLAKDFEGDALIPSDNTKSVSEQGARLNLFKSLDKNISDSIKLFFTTVVNDYTRNPKFESSRFAKVKALIDANLLTQEEIDKLDYTSEEVTNTMELIMKYNEDMTRIQLTLDSIRNTGVPILDNAMHMMREFNLVNLRTRAERVKELHDITEAYFGSKTNFKYNKSRELQIMNKLIDRSTGKFISEFDWNKFYEDYAISIEETSKARDLINILDSSKEIIFVEGYTYSGAKVIKIDSETSMKLSKVFNPNVYSKLGTIVNGQLTLNSEVGKYLDSDSRIISKIDSAGNSKNIQIFRFAKIKLGNEIVELFIDLSAPKSSLNTAIYININGEYKNKTQLQKIIDNKPIGEKGRMATTKELTGSINPKDSDFNPQLKFYTDQYVKHNFQFNKTLRLAFEKAYRIKFKYDVLGVNESTDSPLPNVRFGEVNQEEIGVTQIIPNSEYSNPKYNNLTDKDKKFISDINNLMTTVIQEVFPEKIYDSEFIPYIFTQSKDSIGNLIKKFFGVQDIQEPNIEVDAFTNPKNFFKSNSLTPPKLNDIIPNLQKLNSENFYDYEIRYVEYANFMLNKLKSRKNSPYKDVKEFTSINDIRTFNKEVLKEYTVRNVDSMNFDIPATMDFLFEELYRIKTHKDFAPVFENLRSIIENEEFEAAYESRVETKGNKFIKYNIFGKYDRATRKGTATNTSKVLSRMEELVYMTSRNATKADQAFRAVTRYTSMNVMFFNWSSGVKNVMKGYSDMVIEYMSGNYVNRKEIGKGINMYLSNMPNIINYLTSQTVPNKEIAMIFQLLGETFEDHNEGKLKKDAGSLSSKVVSFTDKLGYSIMTGGEHFMQTSMALSMLMSHRLVGGLVMSRDEYIGKRHMEVLKDILTEDQSKDLNEYVKRKQESLDHKYRPMDYIKLWLDKNVINGLTSEQMKSYIENTKNLEAKAIAEFEGVKIKGTKESKGGFTRIYDLYDFKDGKLKKSESLTNQQEAYMLNRIQRLNQQIHGVYNTLDRNALQSTLLGEVVMQFRKWMWSTWTRYMGVRFNTGLFKRKDNQPFDESLARYRNGAFNELFGFISKPIRQAYLSNVKDGINNPKLQAFRTLFGSLGKLLQMYAFNWHTLSKNEQSDVIRGAMFFANFAVASLALLVVGGIADDDDEISEFEARVIWLIAGIQTEYYDALPVLGWFNFYKRTKESIVPAEKQILTAAKLLTDISMYPFRDDNKNYYQQGQYKGESKIEIGVQKLIPIWRQVFKEKYFISQVNYFNMYNPLFNLTQ